MQTLTCSLEVSVAYLMGLNALGDNCINCQGKGTTSRTKPRVCGLMKGVGEGGGLMGEYVHGRTHVWWKVNFPLRKVDYQSTFSTM